MKKERLGIILCVALLAGMMPVFVFAMEKDATQIKQNVSGIIADSAAAKSSAAECEHRWDSGKVALKATCTQEGKRIYTCTKCRKTKIEIIKKKKHKALQTKGRKPTCTEPGVTKGKKCSVCGEIINGMEMIEPLGHIWKEETLLASTCSMLGIGKHICERCGMEESYDLMLKPHEAVLDQGYPATFTADGLTDGYHCTSCVEILEMPEVIPSIDSITPKFKKRTYTGKKRYPGVIPVDRLGNIIPRGSYSLYYYNNRDVGNARIKVKFKGDYKGQKNIYFKIVPKTTQIEKVTPLKKGFRVKYAKQDVETTGYQIRYTKNASMKNARIVTIEQNNMLSKKISKLRKAEKYYIQVRTYKDVNGKKYYGSWSKKKSIVTK